MTKQTKPKPLTPKAEISWAVVGPFGIYFNTIRSCKHQAIKKFIKGTQKTWELYDGNGFDCVKVKVEVCK